MTAYLNVVRGTLYYPGDKRWDLSQDKEIVRLLVPFRWEYKLSVKWKNNQWFVEKGEQVGTDDMQMIWVDPWGGRYDSFTVALDPEQWKMREVQLVREKLTEANKPKTKIKSVKMGVGYMTNSAFRGTGNYTMYPTSTP